MTDAPQIPAPPLTVDEPTVEDRNPEADLHTIAQEVLAGHWSRGNARRAKLAKAGHDVDAVLDEVNKILSQ